MNSYGNHSNQLITLSLDKGSWLKILILVLNLIIRGLVFNRLNVNLTTLWNPLVTKFIMWDQTVIILSISNGFPESRHMLTFDNIKLIQKRRIKLYICWNFYVKTQGVNQWVYPLTLSPVIVGQWSCTLKICRLYCVNKTLIGQ